MGYRDIEKQIMSSAEGLKRGFATLLKNLGYAVALITLGVAMLVTFTDVAFSGLTPAELAPSALTLLVCSYIIYFSLEDTGERLGEDTEEYKRAESRFLSARAKLSGEDTEGLRTYLEDFSKRELDFRRRNRLLTEGISYDELEEYIAADRTRKGKIPREKRKRLAKIAGMKPIYLSPRSLLCRGRESFSSELENPERGKLGRLMLKLLPTTLCTFVTVSVVLSVKDGMTAADIANGILKLTALPIVGFKGYSQGYSYVKGSLSSWLSTKAELIEGYIATKPAGE